MALTVCKSCKQAFISGMAGEDICPDCMDRLYRLYPAVRDFLRDNSRGSYTARDVSQALNIDLRDVTNIVTLGLVEKKLEETDARWESSAPVEREKKKKRGQ